MQRYTSECACLRLHLHLQKRLHLSCPLQILKMDAYFSFSRTLAMASMDHFSRPFSCTTSPWTQVDLRRFFIFQDTLTACNGIDGPCSEAVLLHDITMDSGRLAQVYAHASASNTFFPETCMEALDACVLTRLMACPTEPPSRAPCSRNLLFRQDFTEQTAMAYRMPFFQLSENNVGFKVEHPSLPGLRLPWHG